MLENGIENVELIPNGIKTFLTNITILKPSKKVKFVYCGRISHFDKGVLYLPILLNYFKNQKEYEITLKIIGEGPDLETLRDEFNKHDLCSVVEYLGVLTNEEVRMQMKNVDFLIFPSLAEGFGLSIVEAQSVGCIPVAFKIDGVTDFIIEDSINGLLCE